MQTYLKTLNLSIIQYVELCVSVYQFNFPCDDWENIYSLSYYHYEIGSMNYYPLLRARSWNNGMRCTVYPKKYAHGFCYAVLCCGYTLTDFPISIRLTSLALWQSNDCPSASKATLMNIEKYFMWIHYERLHDHNKAKHNKIMCIFLGIYCMSLYIAMVAVLYSEEPIIAYLDLA